MVNLILFGLNLNLNMRSPNEIGSKCQELLDQLLVDWRGENGSVIGLDITTMNIVEQRELLDLACENDDFYRNAKVITYVTNNTGNVFAQIVHNDNVQSFWSGLGNVGFIGQTGIYSVPAYYAAFCGGIPERTRRDSEAMDQVFINGFGGRKRGDNQT